MLLTTFHPPQTDGIGELFRFRGNVTLRHDLNHNSRTIEIVTDAGESMCLTVRPVDNDLRKAMTLEVRRDNKLELYVDYFSEESIEVMGKPFLTLGTDYMEKPTLEYVDARKKGGDFHVLEKIFLETVNPFIARTDTLIHKFCQPRRSALPRAELRGDAIKKIFKILGFQAPEKGPYGGSVRIAGGANFYHIDVFGPGEPGTRHNGIIIQHYDGASRSQIFRGNRVDLYNFVRGNDLEQEESGSKIARVMKEVARHIERAQKPLQKPREPLLINGDVVPRPGAPRRARKPGAKGDANQQGPEQDDQLPDSRGDAEPLRIMRQVLRGPKL